MKHNFFDLGYRAALKDIKQGTVKNPFDRPCGSDADVMFRTGYCAAFSKEERR